MEEFHQHFQAIKPSLPFFDADSNLEFAHHLMASFSNETFMEFAASLGAGGGPSSAASECLNPPPPTMGCSSGDHLEKDKRSAKEPNLVPESSSENSSTPVSENDHERLRKKNSFGTGKRGKGKATEKPKEVIHVRARRGQATDSHSLAERVRREKINERMRCLQDLVPGCYKTMGMAAMLDEIINYVQSLQNQVDFLSMKLSAASSFYDFNSDVEPVGPSQGTNAYEVERIVREGYGGFTTFHSNFPL